VAGDKLFIGVSIATFLLTGGVVGMRLLWLARRTRQLPELLIGTALVAANVLFFPLAGASGMGRNAVGEVQLGLFAAAMLVLWFAISCLIAFTWRTFRPHERWAKALALLLSAPLLGLVGGLLVTLRASPPEAGSFEAGKFWTGLIRAPLLGAYGWNLLEALRQYGMAKRRLALGLGDPVVANRFLLWGLAGVFQVAIQATSLSLHVRGVGILADPLGLLVVATGALSAAMMMFLVFLPPAAYRRFVERRARAIWHTSPLSRSAHTSNEPLGTRA
jgi:hypothetical protein